MSIELIKENNFYFGTCKIVAKRFKTEVHSYARTPLQAMTHLERDVTHELNQWKKSRFVN